MIEKRDPTAQGLRFLEVMRREDDGVAFGVEVAHYVPKAVPQFHVDACRRFVKHDDGRFVHQRLGNEDAALHAARKARDHFVRFVRKSQFLQKFVNPRVVMPQAVIPALLTQNFAYRKKGIKRNFLRDDSHCGFRQTRFGDDVVLQDRNAARVRNDDAGKNADQRTFPCPVGAQKSEDFSFFDGKGNVCQGMCRVLAAVKSFRELRNGKSGHGSELQ